MAQNGWVKVQRKSLDSTVFTNPIIWFVWSWCLMKANHQENSFPFNGEDIKINPGQFITGRSKALSELNTLTSQNYRTALKYLEKTKRITTKTTNKFTIITVLNWVKYQTNEVPANQEANQPLTNEQPTTNQQPNHKQEVKNVKNDKNDKKREVAFAPPSLQEVLNYCSERKNKIDPQKFIDFYESKGWMIGKNKMKSWKAAVRTWEGRETETKSNSLNSVLIIK